MSGRIDEAPEPNLLVRVEGLTDGGTLVEHFVFTERPPEELERQLPKVSMDSAVGILRHVRNDSQICVCYGACFLGGQRHRWAVMIARGRR